MNEYTKLANEADRKMGKNVPVEEEKDDAEEKIQRIEAAKERIENLMEQEKTPDVSGLRSEIEEAVRNGDFDAARAAIAQFRKKDEPEKDAEPKHGFLRDAFRAMRRKKPPDDQ